MVTAVINGQTESWMNTYECTPAAAAPNTPATSAAAVSVAATPTSAASVNSGLLNQKAKAQSTAAASSSAPSSSASSSSSSTSTSGGWDRVGYFDAAAGSSDGLVFLNNMGNWTQAMGNALGYSSADGCSAVEEPTTLGSVQIPSTNEVIIFSDTKCSGDSCGAYRPDGAAYHGFEGTDKAFFFEFSMPNAAGDNMPAIWALNSQIPRTSQYSSCSCWGSGCGELDVFEILASGDTRAKSTLHGNSPCLGGDSDYFDRPTGSTIVLGVIMTNSNVHITVMDSFDFDLSLIHISEPTRPY